MNHTADATYDRGLYTYYLDGKEFLRDIVRFTHVTIHTRTNADGTESVWANPTKTKRKAGSKTTEAAGGQFWGVIPISGIFPN